MPENPITQLMSQALSPVHGGISLPPPPPPPPPIPHNPIATMFQQQQIMQQQIGASQPNKLPNQMAAPRPYMPPMPPPPPVSNPFSGMAPTSLGMPAGMARGFHQQQVGLMQGMAPTAHLAGSMMSSNLATMGATANMSPAFQQQVTLGGGGLAADPFRSRVGAAETLAQQAAAAPGAHFGGQIGSAIGNAVSFLPGMGLIAGTAASIGGGIAGRAIGGGLDRTVLASTRAERFRGFDIRNQLTSEATGGLGLDATGRMGHGMSQRIAGRLSLLPQQEAQFDTKQFMQMTSTMAQTGMLRGVQNEDEVIQRVKAISGQLKMFMRIANEPDVRAAVQQMGKLRDLGVGTGQMNTAMQNAKSFARMAGVSTSQMMNQAGGAGAQIFQQAGMFGGQGAMVGMMNRGLATQNLGAFSPAMVRAAGGSQGIANLMTGGVAATQNNTMAQMAMYSMFQAKGGGKFGFDQSAMTNILGGGDLSKSFNKAVGRMRGSGNFLQQMQQFQERMPELREQMRQKLGPAGMMLMAVRQAQQVQKMTGGRASFFTGLRLATGSDKQARFLSRIMSSPKAISRMRQQFQQEKRSQADRQIDNLTADISLGARARTAYRRFTDLGVGRAGSQFLANRAQAQQDYAAGRLGTDPTFNITASKSEQQRDVAAIAGGQVGAASSLRTMSASTGRRSLKYDLTGGLSDIITGGGVVGQLGKRALGEEGAVHGVARGIRRVKGSIMRTLGFNIGTIAERDREAGLDMLGSASTARQALAYSKSTTGTMKALNDSVDKIAEKTGINKQQLRDAFSKATDQLGTQLDNQIGFFSDGSFNLKKLKNMTIDMISKSSVGSPAKRAQLLKMLKSSNAADNIYAKMTGLSIATSGDELTRKRRQLVVTKSAQAAIRGDIVGKTEDDAVAAAVSDIKYSGSLRSTMDIARGKGQGDLNADLVKEHMKFLEVTKPQNEEEARAAMAMGHALTLSGSKQTDAIKAIKSQYRNVSHEQISKWESSIRGMDASKRSRLFGGLGTQLAEQIGSSTFKARGQIRQRQTLRKIADSYKDLTGATLQSKDGNEFEQILKQVKADPSVLKRIRAKGGAKLAQALEQASKAEKGKEGLKERQLAAGLLLERGTTQRGMTTKGGIPTKSGRQQEAIFQQLQQIAAVNAKSGANMQTTVEDLKKIVGGKSGTSFADSVNQFTTAVNQFTIRKKRSG